MTGCLVLLLAVAAFGGLVITPSMLAPLGFVTAACLLWDLSSRWDRRKR